MGSTERRPTRPCCSRTGSRCDAAQSAWRVLARSDWARQAAGCVPATPRKLYREFRTQNRTARRVTGISDFAWYPFHRSFVVAMECIRDAISNHRQAAAHGARLTRHEGGVVRSEERNGAREIFGLAETAERNRLFERRSELRVPTGHLMEERRIRGPRADDIDVDPVARELARQRLRKTDDPGFRARIHRLPRRSDSTRVRGDADNLPRTPLDHRVENGPGAGDWSLQIYRDDRVPGRFLALHERLDLVPTSIVDKHVNCAEAFDDRRDTRRDGCGVGDVDTDAHRGPADSLRCVSSTIAVYVRDRNLRTLLCQAAGDCQPDTACRTGDHCDLACKSSHEPPSCLTFFQIW